MSTKIIGIAASEGLALAKALVLGDESIEIQETKIDSSAVTSEMVKVETAIADSLKELDKLHQTTKLKMGGEKAAIFEAHKELVSDPEMQAQIKTLIREENYSAPQAIKIVTDNYYHMFEQMDDPYFRERSSDIKDIALRLIKHALDLPIIDLSTINEEVILIADDLTPSQTAQLDPKFVKGFATNIGGRTSHAAIMARSLEIPAVLGLKKITQLVQTNDLIALDGDQGFVEISLQPSEIKSFQKAMVESAKTLAALNSFRHKRSLTKDGIAKMIEGNIGSPTDVQAVIERGGDGIGLFRSEFLYMDNDHFPNEEEQFLAYKKVAQAMNGKVVVIRTLDIGGDKKLSYYQFPTEMNPFLGYRAIRFTLDKKEIFETQIRALLRASAFGKIAIMFPMIATVPEFKAAKAFVEECKQKLLKEKIAFDSKIEVGMMIEVPAAAVLAEKFALEADFFSIGTNDLVQYSMAADRMSQNVAYLYQPLNPSILRLIKMTIDGGHQHGRWVGMCGEMAGQSQAIPLLLGLGLDAFSMSASSILKTRSLMAQIDLKSATKLANEALECQTEEEVLILVDQYLAKL